MTLNSVRRLIRKDVTFWSEDRAPEMRVDSRFLFTDPESPPFWESDELWEKGVELSKVIDVPVMNNKVLMVYDTHASPWRVTETDYHGLMVVRALREPLEKEPTGELLDGPTDPVDIGLEVFTTGSGLLVRIADGRWVVSRRSSYTHSAKGRWSWTAGETADNHHVHKGALRPYEMLASAAEEELNIKEGEYTNMRWWLALTPHYPTVSAIGTITVEKTLYEFRKDAENAQDAWEIDDFDVYTTKELQIELRNPRRLWAPQPSALLPILLSLAE